MIFRLQYCNDSGDTAIIDIETKIGVGVQEIEGSGNPFSLQYKTEKSDKSGRFMTSSADIEIYENEFFNIDILKTSNETDIKVSYYINEVLEWQGFVLPDFFSKEIKDNAVISMTASDRINTLKAVTLSDLPDQIELRELAELCLAKTGLTLPLYTMADFTHVDENNDTLFRTKIQSQRLDDEKGRSISCYDILESILIISNAQIVQRKGTWQIINKYQLEQGVGKNYNSPRGFNNWSKTLHNFTFIRKGAIRTITPVASSVGVFQEYGGGRRYPDNYDFRESGAWVARNGFTFTRDNREILKFANETALAYTPVFGSATNNYYILNRNYLNYFEANFLNTQAYLQSEKVEIVHNQSKAEINFEINATAPEAFLTAPGLSIVGASVNYAIIAESEKQTLVLNKNGKFVPLSDDRDNLLRMFFPSNRVILGDVKALTNSQINKGILEVDDGLVSDFKIHIRIYGIPNSAAPTAINFAKFTIKTDQEVAKGTLYKTTQGTDFTREHDIETSIFGDYLTKGLNGYFYDYQNDDTSSLIALNGDKTNLWTAPSETESLPLLQQISRQKARQFSIAHDIVRGDIKMKTFDPLTIFKDCNDYEYVVVSATFDFLRSIASIEIEQILYDSNISRRDFIYSYFGEGESNIKSIGGIAGGGGGTGGGGMTSSQLEMLTNLADWWKLDEENDAIYSEKSVYSLKGVSALGYNGDGGGGGGGGVDMLDSWANYTEAKADFYAPASLLVPFRDDTLSRLASLESGSATSIVTTGSGNAITSLTKSGSVITANKELTFALASHTHTIAQITGLQGALDLKATQSDIDTAIDNLEIGGRNLIIIKDSFENRAMTNASGGGSEFGDIGSLLTNYISVKSGDKIIGSHTYGQIAFYNKDKEPLGMSNSNIEIIPANTSSLRHQPPVIPEDKVIEFMRVAFRNNFLGGKSKYEVKVKLEKGTKATAWTPAPEDQVSDWDTTDATSFSYIKNKPTQLSQFADDIGVASHIANKANPHAVTKSQVGLGNVDNTSDANKPVSTAMQTALNLKANLASPTFTGNVTAPTFVGALSGNASSATNLSRSILAGTGLSGGGTLNANRTLSFDTVWGDNRYDYTKFGLGTTGRRSSQMGASSENVDLIPRSVSGFIYLGNNDEGSPTTDYPVGLHIGLNSNISGQLLIARSGRTFVRGSVGSSVWNSWKQLAFTDGNITGNASSATKLQTPNWEVLQVGTELQFKFNGVIKQRMLSDGTILAVGGITALTTE